VPCPAAPPAATYLFDHERRDLARNLTHIHRGRHALNQSPLHPHLDASLCLEAAVPRGRAADLREMCGAGSRFIG
jgi:CopG family nickel-responsive transcriptional regulator